MINSEEVPSQPGDSTNIQQDPGALDPGSQNGGATQGQGGGLDDPVPLPLPPPPGDGGSDQQGSLTPKSNSNQATNTTAASESQAAEPSLTGTTKADQEGIISAQKSDSSGLSSQQQKTLLPIPDEDPVTSGESSVSSAVPAPAAPPSDNGTESISDSAPAADAPPAPVKKKPAAKKQAEKSLGSKPVVLVPPAENAPPIVDETAPAAPPPAANVAVGGADGGIYGSETVAEEPGVSAGSSNGTGNAQAPAATAPKKKRTIADLFRNDSNADDNSPAASQPVPAAPQQQAAAKPKQVIAAPQPAPAPAPAPAPQQQAAAGAGGYVVQLASFANQGDANQEYGRLKAKHGPALSGLSPIVSQATVGGSMRYRLAVGVMQSREQASAVCAKLFAGGERDCLVRRQ